MVEVGQGVDVGTRRVRQIGRRRWGAFWVWTRSTKGRERSTHSLRGWVSY